MQKLYVVALTEEERAWLERLSTGGGTTERKPRAARALLQAASGRTDLASAYELGLAPMTVWRWRKRAVTEGVRAAIERRASRAKRSRVLDAKVEAVLLDMAAGPPPPGRARWSLMLLAERLVELGVVERICYETVRRALKRRAAASPNAPPAKRPGQ